jgi:hypothetical protein
MYTASNSAALLIFESKRTQKERERKDTVERVVVSKQAVSL